MGTHVNSTPAICIFCLRQLGSPPWCPDNPGKGCTYGCDHEFPLPPKETKPPVKKDTKLCTRCGLHPRNPLSLTNGCAHLYEDVT
jgi:hypothetical protein